MAIIARTWVEGEIATAAKFNTIRDDILELATIAGIASVQYGTITLNSSFAFNNATISAVNVSKTVLHHLGQTAAAGASFADGSTRIQLSGSTTVTAFREGGTFQVVVVGFCVEEHK